MNKVPKIKLTKYHMKKKITELVEPYVFRNNLPPFGHASRNSYVIASKFTEAQLSHEPYRPRMRHLLDFARPYVITGPLFGPPPTHALNTIIN